MSLFKRAQRGFRATLAIYKYWIEVTGLIPPSHRGPPASMELPVSVDDTCLDLPVWRRLADDPDLYHGNHRRPTEWALPRRSAEEPFPSWDNAVRAYEEDR